MPTEPELARRILAENKRVHAVEAAIYEHLHPEIYNWYEQRKIWRQIKLIDRLTREKPLRRALDIGCGTGNVLTKLARLGFEVTGVDISESMLDVLAKRVDSMVTLVCTDVDSFFGASPGERFDVITFSSVLHHLPNYLDSLSTALQRVPPGGAIFITHEPVVLNAVQESTAPRSARAVVSKLSNIVWWLRLRLAGVKWGGLDYSLSDFHAREGIQTQPLADLLCNAGFDIVEVNYDVSEKTGWGALLNNKVFHRAPNSFSLIAQKARA